MPSVALSSNKEEAVRAVLSLVGDLDVGINRLPLPATYVVETSAGNFHATFPLGRALPPSDAKAIAVALSDAIGGDSGTKDISHLWRSRAPRGTRDTATADCESDRAPLAA
jgi:RepB DNA-primase from phage plasmid